jgi:hypothetical protein
LGRRLSDCSVDQLTARNSFQGPFNNHYRFIHVSADETGQLVREQIDRPYNPASAVTLGENLNRGAPRDKAPARFRIDEPPPCIVEIDQQLTCYSAIRESNEPCIAILTGFVPTINDQARHETFYRSEVANSTPDLIWLGIDYDLSMK